MSKNFEHSYTESVVCPHCGEAEGYSHGRLRWQKDGDVSEVTCDSCGEDFQCWPNIEVTFCSQPLPRPKKREDER